MKRAIRVKVPRRSMSRQSCLKISHKLKVDEFADLTNSEPWFEKVLSRG